MASYKITGERYLRMYTATHATPVAAAAVETYKVVNEMCDVPWERVSTSEATSPYHTDGEIEIGSNGSEKIYANALDYNVEIRDGFDAALFCAHHTGGTHRAYANAACYVFEMPAAAIGVTLSSLKATVISDNYNAAGARVHVMASDTLDIPTNCNTCRNDDPSTGTMIADGTSASGVAPRTVTPVDGTNYWYTTVADCTLTPTSTFALKKYLFFFVLLENYNVVRGNWIEGSSYILNKITITTATDITDWTAGSTYDLSPGWEVGSISYTVADSGQTSSVAADTPTGRRSLVSMEGGSHGLHAAYRTMLNGGGEAEKAGEGGADSSGAYWKVRQTVKGWEVEAGAAIYPLVMPSEEATYVNLTYSSLSLTTGAKYRVFFKDTDITDMTGVFSISALWDGIGDCGDWQLLGEVASGTASASFAIPETSSRYATVLIVGYIPPDKVTVETSLTWQGATVDFKPLVRLV